MKRIVCGLDWVILADYNLYYGATAKKYPCSLQRDIYTFVFVSSLPEIDKTLSMVILCSNHTSREPFWELHVQIYLKRLQVKNVWRYVLNKILMPNFYLCKAQNAHVFEHKWRRKTKQNDKRAIDLLSSFVTKIITNLNNCHHYLSTSTVCKVAPAT